MIARRPDKFTTDSRLILANFIATAATLGMPVALLRTVRKNYGIKFKRGRGEDRTGSILNVVELSEDTVQGLHQAGSQEPDAGEVVQAVRRDGGQWAGGQWADPRSVQTLYHEATHAVLDIDDIDESGLFKEAVFLYKKEAKLTNGRSVDDPELVAHEAAAAYVGHRAATAWQIFHTIELWIDVLDNLETGKFTIDLAQKTLYSTTNELGIPEFYESKMRERVFGYQYVDGKQAEVSNYPIPHLLRVYCDSVLENKISDSFAHMWQFKSRYERMKWGLAKSGLREKR